MSLKTVSQRLDVPEPRLNYLVHVDDIRRIAYFETPKVACTSIKKYMQDTYAGTPVHLETKNQVHDRQRSPLKTLRSLADDEVDAVFEGNYKRFSFVRNPYTRALSAYLDKIVTNQWERDRHLPMLGFERDAQVSFLEFLQAIAEIPDGKRDIHFTSQSSLLSTGQIDYAFLGAFERFDADFAHLKSALYDDAVENNYASFGKHHATGASEKVLSYYGFAEQALVEKLYHADFETFGYVKDIDRSQEPPESLSSGIFDMKTSIFGLIRPFKNIKKYNLTPKKQINTNNESHAEIALSQLREGSIDESIKSINSIDFKNLVKIHKNYNIISQYIIELFHNSHEDIFKKINSAAIKWAINQGEPSCDGVSILARMIIPLWRSQPDKFVSIQKALVESILALSHNNELSTAETCVICLCTEEKDREIVKKSLERNFRYLNFHQANYTFWIRNTLARDWLQENFSALCSENLTDVSKFNVLSLVAAEGTRQQYDQFIDAQFNNDEPDTAAGIGFAKIANSRLATRGLKPTANSRERLRIAVCVSGQLRGYRQAFPTWNSLGLSRHDTDFYVHVWDEIGRKEPIPIHAERSFPPPLAKTFAKIAQEMTILEFWSAYPRMAQLFQSEASVTEAELKTYYKTPNVKVEKESDVDEELTSNPDRMYYKMWKCLDMALNGGTSYDLVIWVRPDKIMNPNAAAPDWHDVLHSCEAEHVVFTDNRSFCFPGSGFGMADQFGIGTPEAMRSYRSAWNMHSGNALYGFPQKRWAHTTLAYSTLYNGYFPRSFRDKFSGLGPPVDPEPVSASQLYEAIKADARDRNTAADIELVEAAEVALKNQIEKGGSQLDWPAAYQTGG